MGWKQRPDETPEQFLERKRKYAREHQRKYRAENPERERERNRKQQQEWRKKNRAYFNARARKYRKENPEIIQPINRRHYLKRREKDIEKCRLEGRMKTRRRRALMRANFPLLWYLDRLTEVERNKEWRKLNRDYVRAYHREYAKTPRGRAARKTAEHRRQERKRGNGGDVSTQEWLDVLTEFDNRCIYCGVRFSAECPPTMDHMIPVSRGGPHEKANIVPACGSCNSKKGTRSSEEYLDELLKEP
jgi:5-methylcytosine-specific restriction endonuclease McrA